ncbi:MAG: BsuBI/PstI family type II restriction endonuclease [Anaerolineae bacterium]
MSARPLPPLPGLEAIKSRLPRIFPEGIEHRGLVIREMAAKTVFVMLYVGAVQGYDRWLRPNQVTRMTDQQSIQTDDTCRESWIALSVAKSAGRIPGQWYADNTREPIRDECLRQGLIPLGAVIERPGLATTSSSPRYALDADFADLFVASEETVDCQIDRWQACHLSAAARSRIALVRRDAAVGRSGRILVTFPNGERRWLAAGPSSAISQSVVEEFARRYLEQPAVVALSESGNRLVARDEQLASELGLGIQPESLLVDVLLADLGPVNTLFVFVEVVATDGAVTHERKVALTEWALSGGHSRGNLAFVTAFRDRGSGVYRRLAADIAWGTFVWFASEPESIIYLREGDGEPMSLSKLLNP